MKALLGFAHQVEFTRFNAAPLIKLRKAPRMARVTDAARSGSLKKKAPLDRSGLVN